MTEYTRGSVVIDLVDPANKQLLWRGHGIARVSDQPEAYTKNLRKTVTAILEKLPGAAA